MHKIKLYVGIILSIFFAIYGIYLYLKIPDLTVISTERELPIYSVETSEKLVAITFDCAWGAADIPQIIDILKTENVKASFFLVGEWAEKYPDATKLIAKEGHDMGNHSQNHFNMTNLNDAKLSSEIIKCNETIKRLTGVTPELFRPPYGAYDNKTILTTRKMGMYSIQWSADSLDWDKSISKNNIINRVMKKISPGGIILFHNDTKYTVDLLEDIIKIIKKEGYTIVPVSKLIIRNNYFIDFDGKQKKK